MTTFSKFMGDDHDRCDELYAAAEEAVGSGYWSTAESANSEFLAAMEKHFGMEEEILFPAFEERSGNTMGPTQVMRHEHMQMRQLFEEMKQAIASEDTDAYLGAGETLLILMQQHNAKEEQILYPMTDQVLGGERDDLVASMKSLQSAA